MNPEANVFLRNLNLESQKELTDYLEKNYGKVSSVIIKTNKSGQSLKYGYAQFEKVEDAQKCVSEMNGKEVWGGKLEVCIFKP